MHLATLSIDDTETQALVRHGQALPIRDVLPEPKADTIALLGRMSARELDERFAHADGWFALDGMAYRAPYKNARKVIGIGLNFPEHTTDLSAKRPDEPAFFLKAEHTVVGPGEPIPLPAQSRRVTCEAELGLVVGSYTYRVSEHDALAAVWGVVPVLDQTAEDILQRNPRFLVRAKNFPGFFSFGPEVVPLEEVLETYGELGNVTVSTVHNGELHRSNQVREMFFSPEQLISFLSHVMPLYPGDIISTGTPGAVVVQPGDVVACHIEGVGQLANPVIDDSNGDDDE